MRNKNNNGSIQAFPAVTKDERDITFLRLKLTITNPLIILKPRIYHEECFEIDLGNVEWTCHYNKITGKNREQPEEWRWLTTYQIKLQEFQIRTLDNYTMCSPTNGIINMHFTNYCESDKLFTPFEFDFSYQFDWFFNEFIINLRLKDYTLLLKCWDLNMLYTDGKEEDFNYEQWKQENSSWHASKEFKMDEYSKKKLLEEYIGMFVVFLVPKITVNLFLESNISVPFAELSLEDTWLLFTSKLDYSKIMLCNIGDIVVYRISDSKTKEIIVSDFKQLIHEYENENENWVENLKDKWLPKNNLQNQQRHTLRFSMHRVTNNIIKTFNDKHNQDNKNNIIDPETTFVKGWNPFEQAVYKMITSCAIIQSNIINQLPRVKAKIDIRIDTEREKKYNIQLDTLKFLIRWDTIQWINLFFLEGFPYYDKSFKDWPNWYDSNEENYPGMRINIEIKNPLICILSDVIDKIDQETYCISSEVKIELMKQKICRWKKGWKDTFDAYIRAINENDKLDIKSELSSQWMNLKVNTWKLKCHVNEINPFICTMNQVWFSEKLVIAKRKIMNSFSMTYSSKTQMTYSSSPADTYLLYYKYLMKISTIIANVSFRDWVWLMKVMEFNKSLMGEDYVKNYESLLFFSKEKAKYQKIAKQVYKKENILDLNANQAVNTQWYSSKYKVDGFNWFWIDNQSNTYFPFLNIQMHRIIAGTDSLSQTQTQMNTSVQFLILTYNFLPGLWEPIIEKSQLILQSDIDIGDDRSSLSIYNLTINQWDNKPLNINWSDLSMTFLYSILTRWMGMKNENIVKDEWIEKKMKISNHTAFNYTGRKMIWFQSDQEAQFANSKRNLESISKVSNMSRSCVFADKKLGEILPNRYYEIEYPYKDTFHNDLNTKTDNEISFELMDCDIDGNNIKIDRVQTKVHRVNYNRWMINISNNYNTTRQSLNNNNNNNNNWNNSISTNISHLTHGNNFHRNNELNKYTYIVSKIELHNKKKYIKFYSPLSFKNKTEYIIKLTLLNEFQECQSACWKPKEIYGVPFEYFNGTISISISNYSENNNSMSSSSSNNIVINGNSNNSCNQVYKFSIWSFFTCQKILREIKFNDNYINLVHPAGETYRNKVVEIRTCYAVRNCLPFDIKAEFLLDDINSYSKSILVKKGLSYNCNMVSLSKKLHARLSFLDYTLSNQEKGVTLYAIPVKGNESSKSNKSSQLNFEDKNGNTIDIISTVMTGSVITVIFHPNSVLINHASEKLNFFYNKYNKKETKNKQILSKEGGNIFLLKSDVKTIHLQTRNYLSAQINVSVIGTAAIIRLTKEKNQKDKAQVSKDKSEVDCVNATNNAQCIKHKYKEFVVKNVWYLLSKDWDLYCNIVILEPKYIVWNQLEEEQIQISNIINNKHLVLSANDKKAFSFFGFGEDIQIIWSIKDQRNPWGNWESSVPFNLSQPIITLLLSNKNRNNYRRYINIEVTNSGGITYYKIKNTTFNTASVTVSNYSKKICMQLWQEGYDYNYNLIDIQSKSIFNWTNHNSKLVLCFKFGIGSWSSVPIMRNHNSTYELLADEIYITQFTFHTVQKYPLKEFISFPIDKYRGQSIKLQIKTDGLHYNITIDDIIYDRTLISFSKTISLTYNIRIAKIGISLIYDNAFIDCKKNFDKYTRKEICYLTFEDIIFFMRKQTLNKITKTDMQLQLKSFEIDNEISYTANFPIILKPFFEKGKDKLNSPPLFNLAVSTEEDERDNSYKINLINYLIQSFCLRIESNIITGILNMIKNSTRCLKTSITEIHPIFVPVDADNRGNEENYINTNINSINSTNPNNNNEYYLPPAWKDNNYIQESENIFIQTLEASSIEIIFSFLNISKDKIFDNLLENNPIISKVLSWLSNIDNANMTLNGCVKNNISGELNNIIANIINIYKQGAISQAMKLFASIEIIGNPINFVNSFGWGVKDFFQKPAKGIWKGPLQGAIGLYDGSVSLFKNTFDGAFNSASKWTGGISKGLLLLTQDDDYINNREKKKMTEKPNNIVEGLGFGLTSMVNGWFYGVADMVRKPIEGAKKNKLKGFGKGWLQGLGGFVAKPISGVLDMVSKTSEGLKNTICENEIIKMNRLPRPFYGKFKYIKSYDENDSKVLFYWNKRIDYFKKNPVDFNSAIMYFNRENDKILLIFGTYSVYLIDSNRFELKTALYYNNIKKVEMENEYKMKIFFNTLINKKQSSCIKFSKTNNIGVLVFEMFNQAIHGNFVYN